MARGHPKKNYSDELGSDRPMEGKPYKKMITDKLSGAGTTTATTYV